MATHVTIVDLYIENESLLGEANSINAKKLNLFE
jgi:hypothetical protein